MNLLALIREHSGVDYHRIILPLRYFPWKHGDRVQIVRIGQKLLRAMLVNTDIVLFCRDCPYDLDTLVNMRRELGFKIVVDIDDYWWLSPNHMLTEDYRRNSTSQRIIQAITEADLVTTTHEHLKAKIVPLNKKVVVLSNALPYGVGQFDDYRTTANNILYSCGITHYEDLKSITGFLDLCRADDEIQQYGLRVAGKNMGNSRSALIWSKIENVASRYGNMRMWNNLTVEHYMNHYRYACIAIAPLEDNEFNRCKSFLKALEAGAKNIPLLASAIHPYTEVPVIHCKTNKDWYTNLKLLVSRPDIRAEKGKVLGDYVRQEFNIAKINELRKEAYELCISSQLSTTLY